MGCIRTETRREERLPSTDYRIVWLKCLQIETVKISSRATSFHPSFLQIDKDIDRTYPEAPEFANPRIKDSFRNVLRGFALEFPKVGYTQGLNFVAGMFLLSGFGEEEALRCLVGLCTRGDLMLLGLFEDDFPLCRLYCALFWEVVRVTNPEAHAVLRASQLPDEMWIFQWFITLFTYSLPHAYLKHIFNFIIVKGQFAAVRIAVAVLQSLERHLRAADMREESLIECLEYMKGEEFCLKYLPLEGILRRAQRVKHSLVLGCLQEVKLSNFYKYYFLCPANFREKKHRRFMEELEAERRRYELENDLSNNTRYSRHTSAVNIIDFIEDSRLKRFSRVLSRSSRDKPDPFSSLTFRRCHSLDLLPK